MKLHITTDVVRFYLRIFEVSSQAIYAASPANLRCSLRRDFESKNIYMWKIEKSALIGSRDSNYLVKVKFSEVKRAYSEIFSQIEVFVDILFQIFIVTLICRLCNVAMYTQNIWFSNNFEEVQLDREIPRLRRWGIYCSGCRKVISSWLKRI